MAIIVKGWSESKHVSSIIEAALIGVVIGIALELWVKLEEIEDLVADGIADLANAKQIHKNSLKDIFFDQKYEMLKKEISDLASGKYDIPTLDKVYEDDIRTIERLRCGERLLSTCPISPVSKEKVLEQISEDRYKAAMEAHRSAAKRGVRVTRLYVFRDSESLITPDTKFYFLVFGKRKVSVGEIDLDSVKVRAATVFVDRKNVEKFTKEYEQLKLVAPLLNEVLDAKNKL
jgi:hypothetical protein